MHRWLALGALIYGLLGLAAVLAPRPPAAQPAEALRGAEHDAAGFEIRPDTTRPGWRAEAPAGKSDQRPLPRLLSADGLPASLDFEAGVPPHRVHPDAFIDAQGDPGGSRFLSWRLHPQADMQQLRVPLASPPANADKLHLRLRLSEPARVFAGVVEADGRIFIQALEADSGWRDFSLPLTALQQPSAEEMPPPPEGRRRGPDDPAGSEERRRSGAPHRELPPEPGPAQDRHIRPEHADRPGMPGPGPEGGHEAEGPPRDADARAAQRGPGPRPGPLDTSLIRGLVIIVRQGEGRHTADSIVLGLDDVFFGP
jgi:hypothetical protein